MATQISLDIETTGLSLRSNVLSLSLIADNKAFREEKVPVTELPHINLVIKSPLSGHIEDTAFLMNLELLKKIAGTKTATEGHEVNREISIPEFKNFHVVRPDAAIILMDSFLGACQKAYGDLEIGGKNIAKFDLPMLENFFDRTLSGGGDAFRNNILKKVSYRYWDIGSMFFPYYGEMVSLSKIVNLFGKKEVSHVAYEDGLDSLRCLRLALLAKENPGVALEELAKTVV